MRVQLVFPLLVVVAAAAQESPQETQEMLASDPDVTASGCTCAGLCGASLDQGAAACDWCWTTDRNCGQQGLTGNWDYCIYPMRSAWEELTYSQKEERLWAEVTDPDSVGKSSPIQSIASIVAETVSESIITTFDDQWDVMPEGRAKVIHHQGVVCKFDLDISAKSFTGIFAAGKVQGIIRMGSATPSDSIMGIQPGISLKFLRSKIRSANFVALSKGLTTENYNFFWRSFSNLVTPDKPLVKLGKFQQASGCINQVGLSDVCKYAQNGTEVATPVFPFVIEFDPADASFDESRVSPEELMRQLSTIGPNTHLFDVYTYSSPSAHKAGKRDKFGSLTTTTQCVQSLFGDEKLFFRHQRMEEDFVWRPEWIADATSDVCQASNKPISNWQCASPYKLAPSGNLTSVII
mmetsp:Transcript_18401/g.43179  ORF Transcript_18401/g.43179 Transcript_18401/m.43179 type:complete len:407 (-) Transcript_18401:152-1372(-)